MISENKTGYKETKLGWIPEDWEVRLLGDFFEFKNGLNKEKEFFGYGTPIINYMDVNKKASLVNKDIIGKVSLSENEIKRFDIKEGDVFFTRTSETIEEIAYSTVLLEEVKDGVFSGFVLRARPKRKGEIDINFTKYCFSTFLARKEIISKSTFTTRALTNGRFLSEVNLLIPSLPEQQKIANILNTWDKAIATQEKLIAEKQKLKKGLMQQLLTGEKRFAGFDDEWEEVILNEACNFKNGKGHEQFIDEAGQYVVVNSKFISTGGRVKKYTKTQAAPLVKDDIVMVMSDVPNGKALAKCYLIEEDYKYSLNQRICSLKAKGVDTKFLYYQLNRNKFYLKFNDGLSQTNLKKKEVLGCPIVVPSIEEQEKIVTTIEASNNSLLLMQNALKDTVKQKQGLMQQLLTGEKRVRI